MIAPFQGLRYTSKISDVSRAVAPPYDVISASLQEELYRRDPHNVVRLILGRQFPEDTERENRYTRARADLDAWIAAGFLGRDPRPAFYLYEQQFRLKDGREFQRRGFMALRRLEPFQGGRIRPHEKTLSGPKVDRLELMKACGANLSPIFALYSDPEGRMKGALKAFFETDALIDLVDDDGVRNRLWSVTDPGLFRITDEVVGTKTLFIADGHHRYETAIAYKNWMAEQGVSISEDSPLHYVMMFFAEMSDPGLVILPTHRIVRNRPGFDAGIFRRRVEEKFNIREIAGNRKILIESLKDAARETQALGMILPGDKIGAILTPRKREGLSPVDTAVLHQDILREIMGLGDEEERNPQYLKFVKNAEEVFEASHEAGFNCGFLLNSPQMDVLQKVVEGGNILPPKTTYFFPKLLSGLVFRQIDREGRVSL